MGGAHPDLIRVRRGGRGPGCCQGRTEAAGQGYIQGQVNRRHGEVGAAGVKGVRSVSGRPVATLVQPVWDYSLPDGGIIFSTTIESIVEWKILRVNV